MFRSLKQCFNVFLLFSFLVQTLYPSFAVAMDRGYDEEPITSHERHLKKAGYWSLHKEIKADKSDFLKKNTSIQGHKGVAYLSHLGQQIERLLSIPYPDRVQRDCNELERLSNFVYAASAHACGFSGFDRKATPEEAKRMRRSLTFSLMANPHTLIFQSHNDAFDPYYLHNSERQCFFKGLWAHYEILGRVTENQINGVSLEHYKKVVLPEKFKEARKVIIGDQAYLQKERADIEREKRDRQDIKERSQRSADEEEEPEDEYSKHVNNYFKNLNFKFVLPEETMAQIREIAEADEKALIKREELLFENEDCLQHMKEGFEFEKSFCERFDYDEIDSLVKPYVSAAKNLVGVHDTINVLLTRTKPWDEASKDFDKIWHNDSYYEDDESTDDETPKAFKSLKSPQQGTIEHLLDTWQTNGMRKQFRQYFKDIYWQDQKRKRKSVLKRSGNEQFKHIHAINQFKGAVQVRLQEYQEAKIKLQQIQNQPRQGSGKIVITGATFNTPTLILDAAEVEINSGTSHSTHTQSVSHSNFFGKQAYGQTSYQEVKNPSQLNVNTIILGQDTHLTMVDSTQVRPGLKIQGGSYTIKPDEPAKAWTTSWSKSSQTIPTPVICALSIGAAVLTQGLSTGLMGVAMGAVSGTAVQATLTGNDPFKAIASEGFLKNLSLQLATAGLTNQLSQSLGVNINPGSKNFIDHLKGAALKQSVNASFKVTLGDQKIQEALTSAVKNIGIDAVTGYAANQIGQAYGNEQINSFSHKALHGVLGGTTGYALGGNQQAAISGAVSAVAAEVAFEMMVSKELIEQRALDIAATELTKGNRNSNDIQQKVLASFQTQRDLAKMAGMLSSAALNKDADIAWKTANNAVDNNNVFVLAVRAAPAINWAINNYDKIIKGVNWGVNLYNIYERTDKEVENTRKGGNSNLPQGEPEKPDDKNNSKDSAKNVALHEKYKQELRRKMERPNVDDLNLSKILNKIHQDTGVIGNGSTGTAVRVEKLFDVKVGGKNHLQKANDYLKYLEDWTKNNQLASSRDKTAVENVIKDLKDALGMKL